MKKMILSGLALFGMLGLQAQNGIVSGGGSATSPGGSVSFTIGQVAYRSNTGSVGSVSEGIQQAFVVNSGVGVNDLAINLNAQVYPNPTTEQLLVTINTNEYKNMSYQLLDLQGKLLGQNRIINNNASIDFSKLANGTYFVKILDKQRQLKTFQVIKNK